VKKLKLRCKKSI